MLRKYAALAASVAVTAMFAFATPALTQERTVKITGFGAKSGVVRVFGINSEAAMKAAEEWKVARRDALLERVTFCLRDSPRGDRRVDAVAEGRLQRVAQLARRDSQLLCCVVYDRLALVTRRTGLGCGHRNAASRCSQYGCGADGDLRFSIEFHEPREPARSKSMVRSS